MVFYQYFFIALYKVTGSTVNGSALQDLVYQLKVCTSRSLEKVLAGSHYNIC